MIEGYALQEFLISFQGCSKSSMGFVFSHIPSFKNATFNHLTYELCGAWEIPNETKQNKKSHFFAPSALKWYCYSEPGRGPHYTCLLQERRNLFPKRRLATLFCQHNQHGSMHRNSKRRTWLYLPNLFFSYILFFSPGAFRARL